LFGLLWNTPLSLHTPLTDIRDLKAFGISHRGLLFLFFRGVYIKKQKASKIFI